MYAQLVHEREKHRRRREALARARAVPDRAAPLLGRVGFWSTASRCVRASCSSRTTRTGSTCSRSASVSGSTRGGFTSTSRPGCSRAHWDERSRRAFDGGRAARVAARRDRRRAGAAADAGRVPGRAAARYGCWSRQRRGRSRCSERELLRGPAARPGANQRSSETSSAGVGVARSDARRPVEVERVLRVVGLAVAVRRDVRRTRSGSTSRLVSSSQLADGARRAGPRLPRGSRRGDPSCLRTARSRPAGEEDAAGVVGRRPDAVGFELA